MELLQTLAAPVITGLVTLIGILIANRKAAAVREVREEMREKERKEWEDRVETKLDEHNGYARLFSEQGVTLARIDERLKALEERR